MEQQNRIQYYRKRKGMSQEELGEQLYVSRQTVSQWETGQTVPTVDNLARLRDIFGVSIDDLLGLTPLVEEDAETELPPPAPTVTFRYTEEDIRCLGRAHRRGPFAWMLVFIAVELVMFLWMLTEQDVAVLFGFFAAVTLVLEMAYFNARRAWGRQRSARLLACRYTYTHANHVLTITVTNEDDPACISCYAVRDIHRVRRIGPYLEFETIQGLFVLREADLPDGTEWKTYFLSRLSPRQAGRIQSKESARWRIPSILLGIGSVASIYAGLILSGFLNEVTGGEAISFVSYMWVLFLFLPIPLSSVVIGFWRKRKGFGGTANIIVGLIMCVFLCIFGSFTFTLGTSESPTRVVEREMGIDIPGYEYYDSSASAGILGSDVVSTATMRFTDMEGAAFEASMEAHGQWLSAVPSELEDVQPPHKGDVKFDRFLLYDRTTRQYNTHPEEGAYMVALYYDNPYNTLTIVLYRWDG